MTAVELPNSLALTTHELLAARVGWGTEQAAPVFWGREYGSRRSSIRGTGTEFDTTGPFEEGDDSRFIDWNASARTGQIQVRRYFHETQRPVVIGIDDRLHMYFGTRDQLLSRTAAIVAAALTSLFQRARRPFALIQLTRSETHPVVCRVGVQHRLRLIQDISDHYHQGLGLQQEKSADLATAILRWAPMLPRRADLIIVSDFSDRGESFDDIAVGFAGTTMHAIGIEDSLVRYRFSGRFPIGTRDGIPDETLSVGADSQAGFSQRVERWRNDLTDNLLLAGIQSVRYCHAHDLHQSALR